MPVTQISIGRFHHFHLARQMQRFGLLDRLWTGYPRFKLRDEPGIPANKIASFPWLHGLSMVWPRLPVVGSSLRIRRELAWHAHDSLDRRAALSIRKPGVLIALSAQGEHSGKRMQEMGGWHICDRGSSHIREQDTLMRDEHARWHLPYTPIDPRVVDKEETEYAAADLITVPSSFAERSFLARGISATKLRRISYGARLERFAPQGAPAPERFDVLFVGHVSLRKGVPYLLEAFAKLRHPRKRLRVAGTIDPTILPLLAQLPQCDVTFLGPVANADLPQLYSMSSVLVLPSIEEGLAMVMAEAMACGCPVVASENTGAEDLYDDDVEGAIIPIRSVDALVQAMQHLADDPVRTATLRAACRAKMQALSGWDGYGLKWKGLLQSLPGSREALSGTRLLRIAEARR